jgi:hypothetical protein
MHLAVWRLVLLQDGWLCIRDRTLKRVPVELLAWGGFIMVPAWLTASSNPAKEGVYSSAVQHTCELPLYACVWNSMYGFEGLC